MGLEEEKQRLREEVWSKLEREGVVLPPLPCRGRIPNFKGALEAALNLRRLKEYREAKAIFVNPDSAQYHVRRLALLDGKTVVMATPRLKSGFLVLRPDAVRGREGKAATIKGAFKYGERVLDAPKVDLVVEGSVAVDLKGNRLGKGGGYGDLEIAMVKGRWGASVKVVTTVHSTQVVPKVPVTSKDERVDYIVTEKEIIKTS